MNLKKNIIKLDINKCIICSSKYKSYHCKNICFHGIPHLNEGGAESCKKYQYCLCSDLDSEYERIYCKKLTKKQKDYYRGTFIDYYY